MRKVSALSILSVFTLSLLVFNSCQKGPDDTAPEIKSKCQRSKAYYFNLAGDVGDSMVYTYTDNKLSKISNADLYVTIEYTNNKITKKNYYETGSSELGGYDTITYNTDGTISTIKFYVNFIGPPFTQFHQYDFSYTNGKLTKFELQEYDVFTQQLELHESTTYTYTGNNITKAVFTDHAAAGSLEDTYVYTYDNNENYFTKNDALLTDAFFFEAFQGPFLPLVMSFNNVTNVYDGLGDYPITYKLDSNNNLYEFYGGGSIESRYLYDCK